MYTRTKNWRRWCGPRGELLHAVEQAAGALREWNGANPVVKTQVEDQSGLTETGFGLEPIRSRHSAELRHIRRVVVTIKSRSDEWEFGSVRFSASSEPQQLPDGEVNIRITELGTTFTVEGEDRERVAGLAQRLEEILGRAATASPGFDRSFFFIVGLAIAGLGAIAGALVADWLGFAEPGEPVEAAQIIGAIVGAVVGAGVAYGLWWIFPPVELFEDGGAGRARRFRGWIVTITSAVVISVAASFIYDRLNQPDEERAPRAPAATPQ